MSTLTNQRDPIREIPDPDAIRTRLAQSIRETDILRRLLKVAEAARRDLTRTEQGGVTGSERRAAASEGGDNE